MIVVTRSFKILINVNLQTMKYKLLLRNPHLL